MQTMILFNNLLGMFIIATCILLILFLALKLPNYGDVAGSKFQFAVLTALTGCLALWALTQITGEWTNFLSSHQNFYINLAVFLLTLYLITPGNRQQFRSSSRLIYYLLLTSIVINLAGLIILGSDSRWLVIISDFLLLFLGIIDALVVFNSGREQKSYIYTLTSIILVAFIVLNIGPDLVFTGNSLLVRHFSLWGGCFGVVALFYYSMDQVYFYSTRVLNARIDLLREEYAAEMETVENVVISLARTLDAKDPYTEGHTERVSQYSIFLGERLGFSDKRLENLRIGALIHDIGKIGIDQNILNKPGRLTEEERREIEMHPSLGETICSPLKALHEVGGIIRGHHEKLDGSGYPDGLKGDEISLDTRIVTVADIFDALTTERSYRKALPVDQAIEIMKQEADEGKLDSNLIREFESMLYEMSILAD